MADGVLFFVLAALFAATAWHLRPWARDGDRVLPARQYPWITPPTARRARSPTFRVDLAARPAPWRCGRQRRSSRRAS